MKLPKLKLSGVVRDAQKTVGKYSPQILTGIGIAGMITTTVLAVKATPKALTLIEEKKKELQSDALTPVDTVKATWKCYIPAVSTGVLSAACLIGANSIGTRRTAALATAYKISETALHEYKDAVLESVGEEKVKEIKEKVAEKKAQKLEIDEDDIIVTTKGKDLCLDPWSERTFTSSMEAIKKTINELNNSMMFDMSGYASLNDFYKKLGLTPTKAGDVLGWNIMDGLIEDDISSWITKDGKPCLVIDFVNAPEYGFQRNY